MVNPSLMYRQDLTKTKNSISFFMFRIIYEGQRPKCLGELCNPPSPRGGSNRLTHLGLKTSLKAITSLYDTVRGGIELGEETYPLTPSKFTIKKELLEIVMTLKRFVVMFLGDSSKFWHIKLYRM